MNQELLAQELCQLPIVQYEFFETACLTFSDRVRYICETECQQYGKSWACPPGTGTVAQCRKKCLSYPHALLITTMSEVEDIADIQAALAARSDHEKITHQVDHLVRAQGMETYTLSTESCAVCPTCTYPSAPCRHPDKMFPCVESQGILITEIAERFGIDFQMGSNIVTWFSLILYR